MVVDVVVDVVVVVNATWTSPVVVVDPWTYRVIVRPPTGGLDRAVSRALQSPPSACASKPAFTLLYPAFTLLYPSIGRIRGAWDVDRCERK